MRINLAQAINGIGSVISPIVGSFIFFNLEGSRALQNVQWVYFAIACFVGLLAIVFYKTDLPEVTDADMVSQADAIRGENEKDLPFSKQYRLFHASIAQFCTVGFHVGTARFVTPVSESFASSGRWAGKLGT